MVGVVYNFNARTDEVWRRTAVCSSSSGNYRLGGAETGDS